MRDMNIAIEGVSHNLYAEDIGDKPESIRGRKLVGAFWYYKCDCGEPRGPLLLTGFEGLPDVGRNSVLISGDGTLFLFHEAFAKNMHQNIELKGVVGRRACTCLCANCVRKQADEGDHVWYDWDFRGLPALSNG